MRAKRSEAVEAERSTLGAFLLTSDLLAVSSLSADDFSQERDRTIFTAMRKLVDHGTGVDLVTLKNELVQSGRMSQAGGVAYVAGLADGLPRVNAERLAVWEAIVKKAGAVRRVQGAFEKGLETLQVDGDASSAIEDARRVLDDVSASCGASVNLSVAEQVEAAARSLTSPQSAERGISTGIAGLDRMFTLQPGRLCVVAARPAVGKSNLIINVCEASARVGRGVVLFTAEMPVIEVHQRRVCAESGLSAFRLGAGLSHREQIAFDAAVSRTKARPFYVDDSASTTLTEMRAKARYLQSQPEGLALVAVDYLQLFVVEPKFSTRERAVADFTRGLKKMAMDLGVPVVCASQLNRSSEREDREPRLTDLRESGAIEMDADLVLFLHHGAEGDDTKAILAKARNRATGRTTLRLNGPLFRFEEPAHDHGEDAT